MCFAMSLVVTIALRMPHDAPLASHHAFSLATFPFFYLPKLDELELGEGRSSLSYHAGFLRFLIKSSNRYPLHLYKLFTF